VPVATGVGLASNSGLLPSEFGEEILDGEGFMLPGNSANIVCSPESGYLCSSEPIVMTPGVLHCSVSKPSRRKSLPRKFCDSGVVMNIGQDAVSKDAALLSRTLNASSQAPEHLPAALLEIDILVDCEKSNEFIVPFRQFNCVCQLQIDIGGAIQCSICFHWTHGICSSLSIEDFDKLQQHNSTFRWGFACHRCAIRLDIGRLDLTCNGPMIVGRQPPMRIREELRSSLAERLGTQWFKDRTDRRCHHGTDKLMPRVFPSISICARPKLSELEIAARERKVDQILQGEHVDTGSCLYSRLELLFRRIEAAA
jgi:hypothetical protein